MEKEATFHDGKPITSADVVFSLELVKKNHPMGELMFGVVEKVETPDPYTAIFRLQHPFPACFAAIHPYFLPIQGRPYLDRIIIEFVPDAASRIIALETGATALVPPGSIPPADIHRLEKMPHLAMTAIGYEAVGIRGIVQINNRKPPGYSNPDVDRLCAEARVELNFEKRKKLYHRVQEILMEELPVIWLIDIEIPTLYNKDFDGVPTDVWGVLNPLDTVYWRKGKM